MTKLRRLTRPALPLFALAVFALLGLPGGASAQSTWTTSGNDISNTNTGNVGVGTNSPTRKLEVKAPDGEAARLYRDANFVGWGVNVVFALNNSNNVKADYAGVFGIISNAAAGAEGGSLVFGTATSGSVTEKMRINSAGNVGIGTPAPATTLHLSGATAPKFAMSDVGMTHGVTDFAQSDVFFQVEEAYLDNTGGARLWGFSGAAHVTPFRIVGVFGSTAPNDAIPAVWLLAGKRNGTTVADVDSTTTAFQVAGAGTGTVYLNILGSGNVGVGVMNPAHKLAVAGNVNASGLCLSGDCKTNWSQVGGWATSGTSVHYNAGNVGVGTTAPAYALHVEGASTSGNGFIQGYFKNTNPAIPYGGVGVDGQSQSHVRFMLGGAPKWQWRVGAGAGVDDLRAFNWALNADVLTLTNAGNVGVGTAAPAAKLHVAGDIKVDGNINAKYQDVAEWVPSRQKLSAGTVVVLDPERPNHVLASTSSYDTAVAGVISEKPGLSLGEAGEGKALVATTGRVKVRVDATRAPIKIGDLIVTSDVEGAAMKSQPFEIGGRRIHSPGTIIGKALEPLEKGVGEILVLLSLQ
jgi:hypothetical protein